MYQSKAIATAYSHVTFKSRLEARWAAFFDLMGWQWTYEPYDLDAWIPDFQVGKVGNLAEVKPLVVDEEWQSVTQQIERALINVARKPRVLLLGVSPFDYIDDCVAIGWVLEWYEPDWLMDVAVGGKWCTGPTGCHAHAYDWTCMIEGEHYGGAILSGDGAVVWDNWRKASNVTQWRHNQ